MSAQPHRAAPQDSAPPLIRLRNITKTYGEGALAFQALKGVDFQVGSGEIIGLARQAMVSHDGTLDGNG